MYSDSYSTRPMVPCACCTVLYINATSVAVVLYLSVMAMAVVHRNSIIVITQLMALRGYFTTLLSMSLLNNTDNLTCVGIRVVLPLPVLHVRSCLPLQYPSLYLSGDAGWSPAHFMDGRKHRISSTTGMPVKNF